MFYNIVIECNQFCFPASKSLILKKFSASPDFESAISYRIQSSLYGWAQ